MSAKAADLIRARETIEEVLTQLDVDAYLFEIEPKGERWELKVECAVEEGWGSFTLNINEPLPTTQPEQTALLTECRNALAWCKRSAKS